MPCRDYDYEASYAASTAHKRQINDMKKGLNNLTRMLCGVLHTVDESKMQTIYKQVGGLQEWWERHQRLDAEREAKERAAAARKAAAKQAKRENEILRKNALNKLTPEEQNALGIAK